MKLRKTGTNFYVAKTDERQSAILNLLQFGYLEIGKYKIQFFIVAFEYCVIFSTMLPISNDCVSLNCLALFFFLFSLFSSLVIMICSTVGI